MADTNTAPLTDAERAELEQLRAEKARREEEERARAERAELEALRTELRTAEQTETKATATAQAPAPAPKPQPASVVEDDESAEKSFGVRMVTSDTVDKDGIPTMPMAQKIIMVVCVLLVVGYVYFYML